MVYPHRGCHRAAQGYGDVRCVFSGNPRRQASVSHALIVVLSQLAPAMLQQFEAIAQYNIDAGLVRVHQGIAAQLRQHRHHGGPAARVRPGPGHGKAAANNSCSANSRCEGRRIAIPFLSMRPRSPVRRSATPRICPHRRPCPSLDNRPWCRHRSPPKPNSAAQPPLPANNIPANIGDMPRFDLDASPAVCPSAT